MTWNIIIPFAALKDFVMDRLSYNDQSCLPQTPVGYMSPIVCLLYNTLGSTHSGRHVADDILKWIVSLKIMYSYIGFTELCTFDDISEVG